MNQTDAWRPTATSARLQARARLLRDIRAYLADRGVLEVETPVISHAGNTDPEIGSVRTSADAYLRTSPEFPLKRLLAAGSGDVFELGRVFREGESGRHHNPEFTMLEWYRTGMDYHQLMSEVAQLVRACGRGRFDEWPEERLTYRAVFERHIGLDPFEADVAELAAAAAETGVTDLDLERKQWLDLLTAMVIQPRLPADGLTFVHDFPTDQAALARIRPGSPPVAERFELYLGQAELANGYQELTDPSEMERRMAADNEARKRRGLSSCTPDANLVAAMRHGLPACSGVALGVDRLLMTICGARSIDEVLAFPHSRA